MWKALTPVVIATYCALSEGKGLTLGDEPYEREVLTENVVDGEYVGEMEMVPLTVAEEDSEDTRYGEYDADADTVDVKLIDTEIEGLVSIESGESASLV